MSYLNHLQTAFLLCFGMAVSTVVVPTTFGQEDPDSGATITLDIDEILGVEDEDDEELSRLVDKSTISDLDFLNAGDAPTSIDQLKAMQEHVSSLYQRVEPAVVSIQSGMGQGSGVVVTSDGYILTAAHVISVPNRSAVITFPDGTRARAQTLGLFRTLDAGLLKIYAMMPARKEAADEEASEDEGSADSDADESADSDADESADSEEDSEAEEKTDADESDDGDSDDSDEDLDEEESDQEESDQEDSDQEESDDEESDDEEPGEGAEPEEKLDSESESEEDEPQDESDDDESDDNESDDDGNEDDDSDKEDDSTETKPKKRNRFAVQDDLPSFNYLEIGDSAELNLGQWVIAVGHPGGLDEDRGVVLRVGRINKIDAESDAANFQTDCTLVGGDSGGPLIGMDGSVLGIHSRIGMGLRDNFHVPANDFVNNWSDLLEPVVHDREAMTFIRFRGRTNVIERVPDLTTSARSGLKASDRIIRIGETDIYDKLQFDDAISKLKPYQRVEFEVHRKGKKKVIDVTIGEKPKRERR